VSLVAVFLALAVGIVVGTTALNGPVTSDLRNQVNDLKDQRSQLADQVKTLQGRVDDAEQFASTFGAQLVAGTLSGTDVLIVALPGVSTGMLDGVHTQLSNAGAKITGQLVLAPGFTDPAQGNSINSLATGSGHPIGLTLPETSDPGQLGGALLAYVLLGLGESTDLRSVLSGFSSLHMITSDPQSVEPAKTVVIIGSGSKPNGSYAGQSELDLVSAFAKKGGHVVVAGDASSADNNGIVAMIRNGAASATVSTVDDVDTAIGQVSTALAVVGADNTQVGHYGTATGANTLFPTIEK
jgi:hypothetical protein